MIAENDEIIPESNLQPSSQVKQRDKTVIVRFLFATLQSDLCFNTFTKFHQNLTHSYRDIGFKSRTDRHTDRETE